jgi:nitroimidazol reductase NimA-like FMN-containing flavoprotein (pyridoxamine 5'-phosphate oxidase superfamily)
MSHDRTDLDRLLAATVLGHVGLVDAGAPVVLPTAVVRWEDRLLIHGSTGSRWLRAVASGVPVCVSVAAVDGVLVARSAFESSLLYRSAVLFGQFAPLAGDEMLDALDVMADRILPGRVAELRRPTPKEIAATLVLAMPIREWSLRISDGWPEDPPEDVAGPAWAGALRFGPPPATVDAAPDLRPGIAVPTSVQNVSGIR